MAQDHLSRLLRFLHGEGRASFDWLPYVVPALSPPLLGLVVQIAEAVGDVDVRGELLRRVGVRLPPRERAVLIESLLAAPAGKSPARPLTYRVPEGRKVSLAFNAVEVVSHEVPVLIDGRVVASLGASGWQRRVIRLGEEAAAGGVHEINCSFPTATPGRIDLYVKGAESHRFPDLRLTPKRPTAYLQFQLAEEAPGEADPREYGESARELLARASVGEQERFLEEALGLLRYEAERRDVIAKMVREATNMQQASRGEIDMGKWRSLREVYDQYISKRDVPGSASPEGREGTETDDTSAPSLDAAPHGAAEGRQDIVNLGFSPGDAADRLLDKTLPLACDQSYYFWFNVGRALPQSVGTNEPLRVESLPERARLRVALFGFEGELLIDAAADTGLLEIRPDSSVAVTRQALRPEDINLSAAAPPDVLEKFLFFPVRTPARAGSYRLRCHVYCEQLLIQSHIVTARVERDPSPRDGAFKTAVDYTLSQSLSADHLRAVASDPHRLSLMLNSNGDGSFTFRLLGADGDVLHKDDAPIGEVAMQRILTQARGALHRVSWGNEQPWTPKSDPRAYRYRSPSFDPPRLARDLAYLARAGWRIYWEFVTHLQKIGEKELEPLIQRAGTVQIALKMTPRAVLPAAVVYDYRWKPDNFRDFEKTNFTLCETFRSAIEEARKGGPPLEECDCFKGRCPVKIRADELTAAGSLKRSPPSICPSGFWGYRHSLGLPLTLDGGARPEAPLFIGYKDGPEVVACVSTDEGLRERDPHLERLKSMRKPMGFDREESYDEVVVRLKSSAPHLLYFYCHGGVRADGKLPYLAIGEDDSFAPEDIGGERFSWDKPNPLVFINGCHTTALDPEITLDFVSSFVQQAGAAGVIGTEITIFEQLAVGFAEECLRRFFGVAPHREGMSIGEAVRGARLELLKQGNPLGLVYIPFAVASLRLVRQASDN